MTLLRGFRSSFIGLLVLGGSVAAQGQVFIVDEQNGAGASFTDLPQAVAAVPDGSALVVRPGSYTAFTLTAKGLAIVGEDRAGVRIDQIGTGSTPINVTLEATAASQSILIKNLSMDTIAPLVRNAQGPVIFDSVDWVGSVFTFGGVVVDQSSNVQLHRCDFAVAFGHTTMTATDSVLQISYSTLGPDTSGGSSGGGDALALTRSRCVAFESTLLGDDGLLGCCGTHCFFPGSAGGAGVLARDRSTFYAHACTVRGGTGGNTAEIGFPCGGGPHPGGAGIRLDSNSKAVFEGAAPVGGPGYQGTGPAGSPFLTQAGSTIELNPSAIPSAGEIQGELALGKTIQFTLQANPGSLGVLVLASNPTLTPIEPLVHGSFLFNFTSQLPLSVVPATGLFQLSAVVPANFPLATVFHAQFVTLDPGANQIWVTNAFSMNVNG